MQNQPQFYMVWTPGGDNPVVQHETESKAVTEAERLAALVPGRPFYVLKAIKVSKIKDVITECLQPREQSATRSVIYKS